MAYSTEESDHFVPESLNGMKSQGLHSMASVRETRFVYATWKSWYESASCLDEMPWLIPQYMKVSAYATDENQGRKAIGCFTVVVTYDRNWLLREPVLAMEM